MNDLYFFLLDDPAVRRLDALPAQVDYMTPRFQQPVYEASRGRSFASREEAYADWMAFGRAAGLEYAPGENTLLKIVLKVKDEPLLIDRWIRHHAAVAGLANLVIMDCGSTDPAYLARLAAYRRDVLILRYPLYYDRLHGVAPNRGFYELLAANCRYLTVLDADEFLFGYDGDTLSPQHVGALLSSGAEAVYAPAWIANQDPPAQVGDEIDWSKPIRFSLHPEGLRAGLVAGKTVVRSDAVLDCGYAGHNLHVGSVVQRMTPGSFGRLFQFHLSYLGQAATRARIVKHLRARQLIPAELEDPEAIASYLRGLEGPLEQPLRQYAERYLADPGNPLPPEPSFESRLLAGVASERSEAFKTAIDAFDFERVWRETKPRI